MTEQSQKPIDSVDGGTAAHPTPEMILGIHYTKTMNFQVFNAPAIFTTYRDRPNLALVVDVRANQLAPQQPAFEVELLIRCQGQNTPISPDEQSVVLFEASLTQAGIFTLRNTTQDTVEPLLLIEAPRLLFPAARNILTTMSREAGFLPIIIQQIDFAELWRSRRTQS